jgi:chromate transport protein ChrA
MDPLEEMLWVMWTYGLQFAVGGLLAALLITIWSSSQANSGLRMGGLVFATLALWFGLFLAVDSGYRSWQGIPNPPEEAFSDTGGPFFMLFLGWLPSAILVGLFLLVLASRSARSSQSEASENS